MLFTTESPTALANLFRQLWCQDDNYSVGVRSESAVQQFGRSENGVASAVCSSLGASYGYAVLFHVNIHLMSHTRASPGGSVRSKPRMWVYMMDEGANFPRRRCSSRERCRCVLRYSRRDDSTPKTYRRTKKSTPYPTSQSYAVQQLSTLGSAPYR